MANFLKMGLSRCWRCCSCSADEPRAEPRAEPALHGHRAKSSLKTENWLSIGQSSTTMDCRAGKAQSESQVQFIKLMHFVYQGTSLPARAPNKYAVDLQAFGVMNTRGSTYLTLDLCARSGMDPVRRICQLQWLAKAGSPGSACFELGLTYDGTTPSFTVFLDGHLQGSGEVKFVFD